MLGERLFPLIQGMYPDLAGKITGMLLEIDNSELLHMLESRESLKSKVGLSFGSLRVSDKLWLTHNSFNSKLGLLSGILRFLFYLTKIMK